MEIKCLKNLLLVLKSKRDTLSQSIDSINNDDLLNNDKIKREILRLNTINTSIDNIDSFLESNSISLNDEIELCTNLLILFQKECDELLLLSKKLHKYSDTILTIDGAKLNTVEYKEIANTLNIIEANYDNSKKELLEDYNFIKELFLELSKNNSNIEAFLNKLNALADKIFIFQNIK